MSDLIIRNQFYAQTKFLKDWFGANALVNTVTHGTDDVKDMEKKNIFPLVHLCVLGFENTIGGVNFLWEIAALDIRQKNPIPSNDKFLKNDNELDNLNTCAAIINEFCVYLRNQTNDYDIETEVLGQAEPVRIYENGNGLDGWVIQITLSIPNNNIDVCQD